MVVVFELMDPAQIPPLAEPFFMGVGATFELTPAIDLPDLVARLSKI
jgi:hypothetical protein